MITLEIDIDRTLASEPIHWSHYEMPFGKFRGKKVSHINRQYRAWLMRQQQVKQEHPVLYAVLVRCREEDAIDRLRRDFYSL